MSAIYKKINNTWVKANTAYTKVSGTWKEIKNLYKRINGVWTPVWTFTYVLGDWGTCTVTCGGGTQTRTVVCTRNDGVQFSDDFCAGLTKPTTSQVCNTQACSNKECYYAFDLYPATPAHVYTWEVIPGIGAAIVWDNASIPPNDYFSENITTYIYGGYKYTRGTYMRTVQWDYFPTKYYQVCREPV